MFRTHPKQKKNSQPRCVSLDFANSHLLALSASSRVWSVVGLLWAWWLGFELSNVDPAWRCGQRSAGCCPERHLGTVGSNRWIFPSKRRGWWRIMETFGEKYARPPKTNSKWKPLKIGKRPKKVNSFSKPLIFRCKVAVSFREVFFPTIILRLKVTRKTCGELKFNMLMSWNCCFQSELGPFVPVPSHR